MNRVFVLDKNRTPLMPCHPARARILLRSGKASVYRRRPFTIILNYEVKDPEYQETILKKTDQGWALLAKFKNRGWTVVWSSESG